MLSPASQRIATYGERPSLPYLSPDALVYAPKPHEGIPYTMEGLPLQTCLLIEIDAPIPLHSRAETYKAELLGTSNQYAVGQAPTNGIYTGVEGGYYL